MIALYPWLKALHIISVIAWMAGLLYLPRLFVYHADAPAGSPQSETFKVMERRLYVVIVRPAMLATLVFGISLLFVPGIADWQHGWLHAKLLLVLGLLAFTHFLARWRRAFAEDRNRHPSGFYRKVNEIPTLLMILIVVLVVVRPF
ncbi:MAG TPA: protoporphyrinogen oxidase HemJ [Stellaceae bacterium]|nr:protoporphyrinogen oxidase HemJ [Stellaceae bacterium]